MIPSFAKSTENHLFRWFLRYFDTQKVGVAGFEPAASCSQSRRDNRATLHPVACDSSRYVLKFPIPDSRILLKGE